MENTVETAPEAKSGSKTKQYRLQLSSLKCVRKQDTIGDDDPQLFVNGVSVYGPGSIGKGETVNLQGRTAVFTSVAHIALVEVDPGADDDLGVVTATAQQSGRGAQQGEYHLPHADYQINYQVVTA
jgi:hypothetical protein